MAQCLPVVLTLPLRRMTYISPQDATTYPLDLLLADVRDAALLPLPYGRLRAAKSIGRSHLSFPVFHYIGVSHGYEL